MNTATISLGPWSITAEQEMIPISMSGPVADTSWQHLDAAGHGHFWQDGYPTLEWVRVPCTMGHDHDCDAEGYYRCPNCGEVIIPGTVSPDLIPTRHERGPLRVTLVHDDGQQRRVYKVTGSDAEAVIADPVGTIPRVIESLAPATTEFR